MKIIFGILLFFALLVYLLILFAPYILRLFVRRMSKKMNSQFGNMYEQQSKSKGKNGNISVKQTEKKHKKVDREVGDYIEFEELDK